jgi:hypothetical protein
VGVKVPDLEKNYLMTFEAFEISDVREATVTETENTTSAGAATSNGKR